MCIIQYTKYMFIVFQMYDIYIYMHRYVHLVGPPQMIPHPFFGRKLILDGLVLGFTTR